MSEFEASPKSSKPIYVVLALLIIGGIAYFGWQAYTGSANYVAGQKLAEADGLAQSGRLGKAAALYAEVARGGSDRAADGAAKLKDLLAGPAGEAPPLEAAGILRAVVEVPNRDAIGDPCARGLELAERHAKDDPRGALQILDAVAGIAPDAKAHTARQRALLERAVAKHADDQVLAERLALIYDAEGKRAECEKLLAPHEAHLGESEGARVLAKAYADGGKLDKALPLLERYVEGRLKRLHAAEEAYTRAEDDAAKQVIKELQDGTAPGFDYNRHRAADEAAKKALIQEYLLGRIKDNPALKETSDALAREAVVVPAVLDLGIVRLRRAQELADPAARTAELKKAEETFLAIRTFAEKSDTYRLFLGQVTYWLGRPAEGRRLFDEVLKGNQRSPEMLLAVGRVLREVGAVAEARSLMEEAYNKEPEPAKKFAAARQRALLFVDLDDEIAWLQKSNTGSPDVKASLSLAQGQKALDEGKNEEAAKHLRDSIASLGAMPENSATLNNTALAYFSLYRVTGDARDVDRAGQMLDKALALEPGNSILLTNAASSIQEAAVRDLVGKAIDVNALKLGGRLDLFSYLYDDKNGREAFLERVRKHPSILKGLTYFDRLMVLAPKNPAGYAGAAAVYVYVRDAEGLRKLARRLEGADLDLADSIREALDYYAGKRDSKSKREAKAGLIAAEEAWKTAAKQGKKTVTYAVAASRLADKKMDLGQAGLDVNPDEIVTLAEEAYAAAPSSATRSHLIAALLFRASRALARQEPAYAEMVKRANRSAGSSFLIAVALSREGKPFEAARSNKDVQRAIALVKESATKFPDDPSPWWWVLLCRTDPDVAKKIAEGLRKDEISQASLTIGRRLAPVSASAALAEYWARLSAGEEAKALAVLKQCAARGVPLPFDVK
jgi:hypothetical protein